MWKKIENYYWTLKYLKKEQVGYLMKNRLEHGKKAVTSLPAPAAAPLPLWMEELDEDLDYLNRFSLEELLSGTVTLLHESGRPGGTDWKEDSKSHLWNFNLHYLEFLIPLAAAWRRSREQTYYECFRRYVRRWILDNRKGSGDGWHPYTISLRLTNLWICMDGFGEVLEADEEFLQELQNSMYAQYCHLQKKLELHLLGNHYFENLKAVLLGSLYFQEADVYKEYKKKLEQEIREQILPDGVHYERSMMYHKIILEGLLRTARAMEAFGKTVKPPLIKVFQKMADAAYSLEEGMGQTPLFNDSGDNVARPVGGLLRALGKWFGIVPEEQTTFASAGYYCLKDEKKKLVFDAGEIAPDYMPGHGHCDGLSFELAWMGRPLFVNGGTGQYQGELRSYFRSTMAHNTVVLEGEEQSDCWGEHRVGRRIRQVSGSSDGRQVKGSLVTCTGRSQSRSIRFDKDGVVICDQVSGQADSYLHLAPEYEYVRQGEKIQVLDLEHKKRVICEICLEEKDRQEVYQNGKITSYAPEFGLIRQAQVLKISWEGDGGEHRVLLRFPDAAEEGFMQ